MIEIFASDSDRSSRLHYLSEALEDLGRIAITDDHEFLAYLIDMARLEAATLASRDGDRMAAH